MCVCVQKINIAAEKTERGQLRLICQITCQLGRVNMTHISLLCVFVCLCVALTCIESVPVCETECVCGHVVPSSTCGHNSLVLLVGYYPK